MSMAQIRAPVPGRAGTLYNCPPVFHVCMITNLCLANFKHLTSKHFYGSCPSLFYTFFELPYFHQFRVNFFVVKML